jgi:hypothetical protein
LESQTTPCNWFYRVGVVVWGEPFPLQSEPDPNDMNVCLALLVSQYTR